MIKKAPIKFSFVYFLLIVLILAPAFEARAATIQELQKKQAELDRQIQQSQAAIKAKKSEISNIEGIIDDLQDQINLTLQQIEAANNKINLLNDQIIETKAKIAQKEQELAVSREKLHETIRVVYESSNQSTLEAIVAANSLTDAINQSQYLESLTGKIDEEIAAINSIKASLETQKKTLSANMADVQTTQAGLVDKKKNLDIQEAQKNQLLNQSVAEKNNYQAQLTDLIQEKSVVSDSIYAQRRASGGGNLFLGSSDYPYYAIDVPDAWGFLTRECTSYAAWYLNVREGKRWYNTQPGRGSARYWDEIARTLGWTVSSSPQIGAAISWKGPFFAGDQWGHVAIVESVNSDGTIDISEFNWVKYSYSYRSHVRPGAYGAYVYIY